MILAIDTATRNVSLALHNGLHVLAESTWRTEGHHTVELPPAIEAMMTRVGVTMPEVQAIAVPTGPGSYTGLRIGMSVAKGMALSAEVPLIGIPTLNVLAVQQPRITGRLCVVTQAGRKRVNAGFYHWSMGGWMANGEPVVVTWPELAEQLKEGTQVSGEIDAQGLAVLEKLGDDITLTTPAHGLRRAGFLAELAYGRFRNDDVDDPATLAPQYLT